jgi:hypothetical protein
MGPRDQGGVAVAAQPNNLSWPGKVGSGSTGSGSPSSWPEQPGLKYHNRTMSESPGFTDPKYEVMAQGKSTRYALGRLCAGFGVQELYFANLAVALRKSLVAMFQSHCFGSSCFRP